MAKELQMEIWLLLTAYSKSPAPYLIVPSQNPTTYRLATIHPWQMDRQIDRRRQPCQCSIVT